MSDAFISYRRKPSAPQASLLQEKLKNRHNIDAYLDTTRTDSTKVSFPERLMGAIEESPTFILMLGDTTLESEWVLKEVQRAYELQKHCIPVFQESYTPTNSQDPAVNYVLNFDGVHLFDVKNIMIDESVANVARLIIGKTPIQPEPISMIETRVRIAPKAGVMLGIMMVVLVIMTVVVLAVLNGANPSTTPTPDPTHTPESVALVTDEDTHFSPEILLDVAIVGDFQHLLGCGGDWDPTCIKMQLHHIGNGIYENTFTLPPDIYEYRVVIDYSWDINYGDACERDGNNIIVVMNEESEIAIKFDSKTGLVFDSINQQSGC